MSKVQLHLIITFIYVNNLSSISHHDTTVTAENITNIEERIIEINEATEK